MFFVANGIQSWTLYPSGGSSSAGASIVGTTYSSSNSAFRWDIEPVNNIPNQIHIYNTETGSVEDNTVHTIRPGQTLTLADLGIGVGVTSCNSNDQSITWQSGDTQIVSINSSTGTITAGSAKCRATTITVTSPLGLSTQYIICVTPVTLEAQQTEYWCWVASARMFAENYTTVDDEDTQAKIVADLNLTDDRDGGSPEDIANAINLFAESDLDIGYSTSESIITKSALINSLDLGHVVGACLQYPELPSVAPGHALLIVAYTYIDDDYQFIIFDPWPVNQGTVHIASYEQIRNGQFSYSTGEGNTHLWFQVVVSNEIWGIMTNRLSPT